MKRSLAALFPLLLLAAAPAWAAVRFAEWTPGDVGALVDRAAAEDRLVMVLITQPDWCPACIELDRRLIRNPEARDIAALTEDWLVLEVLGYDAPGEKFLADQGLSFLGTPTTLLLKPAPGQEKLGQARQLAAVVGAPEDYTERLRRAAEGFDAIATAQARVRETNDAEAWVGLARAYLEAGDAEAARRAYRSVLLRDDLPAEERRALGLEAIVQPTQRVAKDHERALRELDAWASAHPGYEDDEGLVFARAWSLLALDRLAEARALIDKHYLEPGTPDGLADYLYLVFRHPTDGLLADAETRAREGIGRYPEQRARLSAAHGRLLRRQGRLEEAEAAFEAAVAAAEPGSASAQTYLGQLEYVRKERRAAGG